MTEFLPKYVFSYATRTSDILHVKKQIGEDEVLIPQLLNTIGKHFVHHWLISPQVTNLLRIYS